MKLLALVMGLLLLPLHAKGQTTERKVFMNEQALTSAQIQTLEKAYRIQVQSGKYWCDSKSGLWGLWGGSAAGFMQPAHCSGKLPARASNGNSGVFINGRELGFAEAVWWASLVGGHPVPGKYSLDAAGTFSGTNAYTGLPYAFNIVAAAQAYGRGGGWSQGGNIHRGFYSGVGSGSQGGCNYVIGSDFSYTGPGC